MLKGNYILLIYLSESKKINVGKLGGIDFQKGYYVYVGSAFNGIDQRINRHLNNSKKIHWHIDYFLRDAVIKQAYYKTSVSKDECKIANVFNQSCEGVDDFGCSDCKCGTHLFKESEEKMIHLISSLGFNLYVNEKP
jgi:Uri superfamily endonuclease